MSAVLPRLVLVPLLLINEDTIEPPLSVDVRKALYCCPESYTSCVQILLSSALSLLYPGGPGILTSSSRESNTVWGGAWIGLIED